MEPTDITIHLAHKGVKPTANRILVLQALRASGKPMCLSDLEEALWTLDKSSIFRVLTLFLEHDIVHAFEDGRGILNYELCTNEGVCNLSDAHIHFYCQSCQQSSAPTPSRSSSKVNARNAGRNISKGIVRSQRELEADSWSGDNAKGIGL